jgi:hypothetical protein
MDAAAIAQLAEVLHAPDRRNVKATAAGMPRPQLLTTLATLCIAGTSSAASILTPHRKGQPWQTFRQPLTRPAFRTLPGTTTARWPLSPCLFHVGLADIAERCPESSSQGRLYVRVLMIDLLVLWKHIVQAKGRSRPPSSSARPLDTAGPMAIAGIAKMALPWLGQRR